MPAQLKFKLSEEDFKVIDELQKESYQKKDFRLHTRCQALIALGYKKKRKTEVASILKISTASINNWIKLYKEYGVEGLRLKACGGSKAKLTEEQFKELSRIIEVGPEAYGYDTGVWTSPIVREVVKKEFHVTYDVSHIRRILDKLGFSVQYPRVHLSKADHKAQKKWLKKEYPAIKKNKKREWSNTV